MSEATQYFGNRPILLGRELTKLHQEFIRGTASILAQQVTDPRGEYTVVVGPAPIFQEESPKLISDERLASEFWVMTNNDALHRRDAVKTLAKQHRVSAKAIYAAIERAKLSGK